ncbi:MAG: sensor histidine kinase [Phocaeicola sp.]
MNYKGLNILAFIGLLAIVILQTLWLCNVYISSEKNIYKESNTILVKAARREISIRFQKAPKGTEIIGVNIPTGKNNNELAPEIVDLNEGLSALGFELSLKELDSIASVLFKEIDLVCSIVVCKLNPQTEKLLSTSQLDIDMNSWGVIKSNIIPITSDNSQGIQIAIINPYTVIVKEMILLLIASVLIMIFVILCIIYQYRMIIRLNQISKIREDFSYALIHDMKTPLSTILATLSFLRSGRLDDKPVMKANYYRIAESEADHLLTLTNKVLTLSKLEHQRLEMFKSTFALEPMVEKLTEKFTTKSTKPVRFEVNLQAPELYADEEYLEGVLSNLIDNAIKYSKASVNIEISSERTEQYTLLKVRDNGLGISEADQRIIFAKYERAAASKRNRKGGAAGFGLGLNFVEQVVSAHEGKVLVNSIEGEFTEFTIYLPHQTATT